jgi:hypothetical protein
MSKNKLTYFAEPELGLSASFSEVDEGILCKRALVLVAGKHKDNKQRWHEFSEDRLHRIAENSNALFQQGTRIPLLKDHNKTQDSVVGDIDSHFEVREITEENLPNPKHRHLIGRLGLFVDNIVVRSRAAIEQAKEGLLNTISPGIDILTDTIREVSFTPTPAIVGLSMFNRYSNSNRYANFESENESGFDFPMQNGNQSMALSFDELEQEESDLSEIKNDFEDLCAKLWQLTQNILTLPDEVLQGLDRQQLVEEIISQFFERYTSLIGMNEAEEQMEDYQDPRMMMNSPMYPGMGGVANQLQGGSSPTGRRPGGAAYSNGVPLACFSMSEMENTLVSMTPEELAEFGYTQAFKYLGRNMLNPQGVGRLEVARKFGTKMINATRGKLNRAGRFINRLGTDQPGGRASTAGRTQTVNWAARGQEPPTPGLNEWQQNKLKSNPFAKNAGSIGRHKESPMSNVVRMLNTADNKETIDAAKDAGTFRYNRRTRLTN